MYRCLTVFLLCCASCSLIRNTSSRIEESHYALYEQEALLVSHVGSGKVYLVNPSHTRCYFLKGRQYIEKWTPGDTLIIDKNLDDFYHLKFAKECDP